MRVSHLSSGFVDGNEICLSFCCESRNHHQTVNVWVANDNRLTISNKPITIENADGDVRTINYVPIEIRHAINEFVRNNLQTQKMIKSLNGYYNE